MIGIEQLSFDPTDAATIAAGSNVGAYLRAGSDGDLLTSTLISGKEALDVNVANALAIDVDLTHIDDSVRLGDGTSFFTSTSENSDIALDVHISNTSVGVTDAGGSLTVDAVQLDIDDLNATDDAVSSWTKDGTGTAITSTGGALDVNIDNASLVVTATDLDIRDLTHVSDSVKVGDGTDFLAIAADGSIAVTDNGASLTVDAVDLDIRDLSHTQDSIQLGDGTDVITSTLVGSDQGLDVNVINDLVVSDLADTAINSTAKSVTTTTGVLLASQLASRKYLYVQNLGTKKTYIGEAGVTTSNGLRLSPGAVAEFRMGPSLSLHAVAEAGTQDIRLMEVS